VNLRLDHYEIQKSVGNWTASSPIASRLHFFLQLAVPFRAATITILGIPNIGEVTGKKWLVMGTNSPQTHTLVNVSRLLVTPYGLA
jgi:hypothetical protein